MLSIEIFYLSIENDLMSLDGCQMIMHNVDEYPFEDKNLFVLEQVVQTLEITPIVIEGDESLKTLDILE